MRQLFRSCVLLITDFAASAWYGPGKVGAGRLVSSLEKVQRLGARMITTVHKYTLARGRRAVHISRRWRRGRV